MYEVLTTTKEDTFNPNVNVTKIDLHKLQFVNIGSFYDKKSLTTKKVYLVGKVVNTRNNDKDLETIFNFNIKGLNETSLDVKKEYTLSAYFSFICLFTLIIE